MVLYSKGWYGISTEKNFMELVGRLIKLDGHYSISDNPSNEEIAHYMLIALDEIHQHLDENDRRNRRWLCSPIVYEEEVNRKIRLHNVTRDEAIVLCVLNVMMMLSVFEIELDPPVYGKGIPRYTGGQFSGKDWRPITYKYMRKKAEMWFNKKSN